MSSGKGRKKGGGEEVPDEWKAEFGLRGIFFTCGAKPSEMNLSRGRVIIQMGSRSSGDTERTGRSKSRKILH